MCSVILRFVSYFSIMLLMEVTIFSLLLDFLILFDIHGGKGKFLQATCRMLHFEYFKSLGPRDPGFIIFKGSLNKTKLKWQEANLKRVSRVMGIWACVSWTTRILLSEHFEGNKYI